MSALAPLTDQLWSQLLDEIHRRLVLPVVGPEMVTVSDAEGQSQPLYRHLSAALASKLGGSATTPAPKGINEVVCDYLLQGKNGAAVYDELRRLVEDLKVPPSTALLELASISDFDLFISTTFDPLLVRALEQVRHGFKARRPGTDCEPAQSTVIDFHYRSPQDLPSGPGTRVYHLLGSIQTYPDFAVWEEDYLEFMCGLLAHEDHLKNLFRALKQRNLLLLGAPFSDWVVRFFLRIAKGERFTDRKPRTQWDYLADYPENLGEPMIFFFDRVVGCTRIIPGSPADFVMELGRQWRQRYADDGSNPLEKIPNDMPKDSVFISYSHDDLPVVVELVRGLRAARIPVWLDKHRLQIGENYESQLGHAVKDACSFFISVISRATEASAARYVHKERAWAAQRHTDGYVFYLPVIVDDVTTVRLEPAEFAKIHRYRLEGGKVTAEFAAAVRRLVEDYRISGRPRS